MHDLSIFNPNDTVSKLGDLIIMSNHYKGLVEFLTGYFQKSQYITAGSAVQVSCRFVSQNQLWICNNCSGYCSSLFLSARYLIRIF